MEEPVAFDDKIRVAAALESLQLRIQEILGVCDLRVAGLQRVDQAPQRPLGVAELVDQVEDELAGRVAVACLERQLGDAPVQVSQAVARGREALERAVVNVEGEAEEPAANRLEVGLPQRERRFDAAQAEAEVVVGDAAHAQTAHCSTSTADAPGRAMAAEPLDPEGPYNSGGRLPATLARVMRRPTSGERATMLFAH